MVTFKDEEKRGKTKTATSLNLFLLVLKGGFK